ncbi:MAG TPA: riboflavin synthase [Vicinamibacterales bacterium]|jgi:riboflavin synthase|nr:riboflavin synthase [Vicinamibacterales bacterium]|tara:strand:+ start:36 stop:638 length:603 start_codon:yes stop_codon:yes gene_type:complete
MFTGLIESTGTVRAMAPTAEGFRLGVDTDLVGRLALGDSIATNGVCLTVVAVGEAGFEAEISPETARVTALGALAAGHRVNLERPMRADALVGGHFVQGHVDATGRVRTILPEADYHRVRLEYPSSLAAYLVLRGSIAVDGVSLTIAALDTGTFDVQIIPFTWEHTTFGRYREGDTVNLECDILGKYVVRALEVAAQDGG